MSDQANQATEKQVNELCQKAEGLGYDFSFEELNQNDEDTVKARKKICDNIQGYNQSLREFEINFKGNNFTEEQTIQMLQAISQISQKLTKLNINLSGNIVGNKGFEFLVKNVIQDKMRQITDLRLNLCNTGLQATQVSKLISEIKQMSEITQFQLNISGNQGITYDQFAQLEDVFAHKSKLTHFELQLDDIDVSQEGEKKYFAKAIASFTAITNLVLSFNNGKFGDNGLKELGLALSKQNNRIVNIQFEFMNCGITQQGLNEFSENFKILRLLQDIHFNLSKNEFGQGFRAILNNIASFNRINSLHLYLDYTQVNNAYYENFQKLLSTKTLINEMTLSLENCDIEDKFIIDLIPFIQGQKFLSIFQINLYQTKATQESTVQLWKALQDIQKLPYIKELTYYAPKLLFTKEQCAEFAKVVSVAPILRDLTFFVGDLDVAGLNLILDECKKRHYVPRKVVQNEENKKCTNFLKPDNVNFVIKNTSIPLEVRKKVVEVYPFSCALKDEENK